MYKFYHAKITISKAITTKRHKVSQRDILLNLCMLVLYDLNVFKLSNNHFYKLDKKHPCLPLKVNTTKGKHH